MQYIIENFVKETMQSKGIGKQLLNHVQKVKSTLRLNVYQKNEKAIKFYLREKFSIQSEDVDDNTGEKEIAMVWN
jgi:putative acetyltransferase